MFDEVDDYALGVLATCFGDYGEEFLVGQVGSVDLLVQEGVVLVHGNKFLGL